MDEAIAWYNGAGTTQRRHIFADERGSVIAEDTGSVLNTRRYDEYGNADGPYAGRFQYTGQMWLGELGLNHYKARAYTPKLGRFLQTDPIGYQDQMNLYAYVGNDPLNAIDPSGEQCTALGMLFGGAVRTTGGHTYCHQAASAGIQAGAGLAYGVGAPAALGATGAAAACGLGGCQAATGLYLRNANTVNGVAAAVAGEGIALSRSQAVAVRRIENVVHNHAKPHDFMGVLREGVGVLEGNHIKEMRDSVIALNKSVRTLTGSLENPNLTPAVRQHLTSIRDGAQSLQGMMKRQLDFAQRSMSLCTSDSVKTVC